MGGKVISRGGNAPPCPPWLRAWGNCWAVGHEWTSAHPVCVRFLRSQLYQLSYYLLQVLVLWLTCTVVSILCWCLNLAILACCSDFFKDFSDFHLHQIFDDIFYFLWYGYPSFLPVLLDVRHLVWEHLVYAVKIHTPTSICTTYRPGVLKLGCFAPPGAVRPGCLGSGQRHHHKKFVYANYKLHFWSSVVLWFMKFLALHNAESNANFWGCAWMGLLRQGCEDRKGLVSLT